MADKQLTATRVRRAVEILAEEGAATRLGLWERVSSEIPLTEDEQQANSSGRSKGMTDYLFATSPLVRSGWIHKDGRGGWSITESGRTALIEHRDPIEFIDVPKKSYNAWYAGQKREQEKALAERIVTGDRQQELVIAAAQQFIDQGLRQGRSVFAPERSVWTPVAAAELEQYFVEGEYTAGMSFREQIALQLVQASDDAKLLMAELVAFQLLPASIDTIGARAKEARVRTVLDLMEHPVTIPTAVLEAFGAGAFNPGVRMANNLGAAMTIIVNFVSAWVELDVEAREDLLQDPWALRDFVNSIPGERFPSQRSALMYLVHPETFISIVSIEHKEAIRRRFIGEIGGVEGDLDRDMLAITVALQQKNGQPVAYYQDPIRSEWWPSNDETSSEPVDPPVARARAEFPPATAELAASLYADVRWVQSVLTLLERRRQIILYGPPGTGKTFIGQALAQHIAAEAEWSVVQFHPSYAYEDFVAGYRPEDVDGTLLYRLKRGPFLRLADVAAKNPDRNYVLLIDEINRGNIAKIFGELYFLLEYRDKAITLLYGDDTFQLPSNVFIIGTMNTSDRSIALLDAAMRRRFAFVELHPDKEPTRGVLRSWLSDHSLGDEPARLLEALNSSIADESMRVGPSYLMPPDHRLDEDRLHQIWEYEIMPLLEETHFGEGDLASRFGLEALRRRLRGVGGDEVAGSSVTPGPDEG